MAQRLTFEEVSALPLIDYAEIRKQLQTGDIFFTTNNGFVPRVIRWVTKSTWAHVGIIYCDDQLGRVLFLESTTKGGVHMAPLSKHIRGDRSWNIPAHERVVITRLKDCPSAEELKKVISFGMDELTRKYDMGEALVIFLRTLFKRGRRRKNSNYICSELVYECFLKAGVEFKMQYNTISPANIWEDDRVELLFRTL